MNAETINNENPTQVKRSRGRPRKEKCNDIVEKTSLKFKNKIKTTKTNSDNIFNIKSDSSSDFDLHTNVEQNNYNLNMEVKEEVKNNNENDNYDNQIYNINVHNKNIACWWCSYNEIESTFRLPTKYTSSNDEYTLFGFFCTLKCASAYNCEMNDMDVWYRYGLLKKYYDVESIDIGPPKLAFEKFGGRLKYDDYLNDKFNKNIRLVIEPMMPIKNGIAYIEELNNTLNIKKKTKNNNIDKKYDIQRTTAVPGEKLSFFKKK